VCIDRVVAAATSTNLLGSKRCYRLSNGLCLTLAFQGDDAGCPGLEPACTLPQVNILRCDIQPDPCTYFRGLAAGAGNASNVPKAVVTDDVHPLYATEPLLQGVRRPIPRRSFELRRSIGCRNVIDRFASQPLPDLSWQSEPPAPVDNPALCTRLAWLEGLADSAATVVTAFGGYKRLRINMPREPSLAASIVHLLHTLGVQPRTVGCDSSQEGGGGSCTSLMLEGPDLARLRRLGFQPKRLDVAIGEGIADPSRRKSIDVTGASPVMPLLPGEIVYRIPMCSGEVVVNGVCVRVAARSRPDPSLC
jgi:hypothetical protein